MGELRVDTSVPFDRKPKRPALPVKEFKGKADPDWCPGCGDFGVLNALKIALSELGLQPHDVLTISDIGCSSNLPGYINTYGMHTLHGRALAVATGAQLANHKLKVVVTGGDGDGFGIGGNHFLHVMRRNVDLAYLVMDNQIYGLTTGQLSPTSRRGMKTKTTPEGSVEDPVNPIPMAIACGATYVARGYSGNRSTSSGSSKAPSSTADSPSSTSSVPASPTTRTTPTTSSRSGRRSSRTWGTIRPTSTPRSTAPANGTRRSRSGSSTSATPRRSTNASPCSLPADRSRCDLRACRPAMRAGSSTS